MEWKKLVVIGGTAGAAFGLFFGLVFFFSGAGWHLARAQAPKPWDANALKANYVGAQLRLVDPNNAALLLSYNVQNETDVDFRLTDSSGLVIMSRLRADGSLSSEEKIKLSYPTFLPAHQRARLALEVLHPFDWPADSDPARQEKIKEFVNQRLAGVQEFVLFDQSNRFQIEFPKGWQDLQLVSAAKE
jgi:hypothetical protein